MNYNFNKICGDIFDRLDYEAHAAESMCLYKHGAITYKNMMI